MQHTLIEAILAKCQRDRWFGPEYYNPRRYDANPALDYDAFPDEDGNFPPLLTSPEQYYSSLSLDDPERTDFVLAKATSEQVASSEERLGFALPPVLHTLYQELANGGFGPSAGLRGVEGGYRGANHEGTLIDLYPRAAGRDHLIELDPERSEWFVLPEHHWPRRMLCLVDLGCVQEACVDAGSSRMYLRGVTEEDRLALIHLPWMLEEWLWRWVRGESLVEQYPRKAA